MEPDRCHRRRRSPRVGGLLRGAFEGVSCGSTDLPARCKAFRVGALPAGAGSSSTSFYVALAAAGADDRRARAASFWPAATWNRALNRTASLGDRPRAGSTAQWVRSVTASVASAAVNVGAYIAITTASPWLDAHWTTARAHGVALGAPANFWLAQLRVYRSAQQIDGVPPRGNPAWKEILQ